MCGWRASRGGGGEGEGGGRGHHNRAWQNNCSGVYANAYLITTVVRGIHRNVIRLNGRAVAGVTAASRTKTMCPNDRARAPHRPHEDDGGGREDGDGEKAKEINDGLI